MYPFKTGTSKKYPGLAQALGPGEVSPHGKITGRKVGYAKGT